MTLQDATIALEFMKYEESLFSAIAFMCNLGKQFSSFDRRENFNFKSGWLLWIFSMAYSTLEFSLDELFFIPKEGTSSSNGVSSDLGDLNKLSCSLLEVLEAMVLEIITDFLSG